jgi:hypothetical protein
LKVLLDECVDSRFAEQIRTLEVHTVIGKGWAGVTNGKLLALAQAEFVTGIAPGNSGRA